MTFIRLLEKKAIALYSSHTRIREARKNFEIKRKVEAVLSDPTPPSVLDSEDIFEKLQIFFPPCHNYAYDLYGVWDRGVNRALEILKLIESAKTPGLELLEAGCGDGMTGNAFKHFGHNVTLIDIEDWLDPRAKNLPFIRADLCTPLPFGDSTFDLIYSFNTLEHVKKLKTTLQELMRVCKTGGHIYTHFGPLYWSPWGLHAYRSLLMPYPQALFSMEFIKKRLLELGISDLGKNQMALQPLNGWTVSQYDRLWRESGAKIVYMKKFELREFLPLILEFPKAFRGRNLTFEDVVTKSIFIILKKP